MTTEARKNQSADATPSDQMPIGFICPKCLATKFGTVRLMPVHIIKCHGLSSDGPPFGCGWQGTWKDVHIAWHRRDAVRDAPKAAASIKCLRLYFCQDLPQFSEHCGIKPSDWERVESGEIPIATDSTIERALAGLAKVAEQWRIERGDFGRKQPEKVEPPVSEARRFVCPKCGAKRFNIIGIGRLDEHLQCDGCNWRGTRAEAEAAKSACMADITQAGIERNQAEVRAERQAEVEAAKGEASLSDAFVAAAEIEAATPIATVPLTGSSALGVEVNGLKQQLAAERQAREAAEKRAEQAGKDRDSWKRSFESQNGEIRRLSDEMADNEDAIERLREIGRAIGCDHVGDPDGRRKIVNCVEESMQELQQRAEQAEAAAGVNAKVIQDALELYKAADEERLNEQKEANNESAKWRAEGDMYGCNFHQGKAGGMNTASIVFYRVRRFIEAALASDAGRAAANELRALRTFRAEIEQDYQAWANATIGEAELRIRLGVARNKVDKAIAGQGGTGKEGRNG